MLNLREQIGQQIIEAVELNVDVITNSEWFREIVQEAVRVELAKNKQEAIN